MRNLWSTMAALAIGVLLVAVAALFALSRSP